MLGIPYEGRIPDFSAQPALPDQPTSPTAVAGRAVRQEQDYAYQQSLQVGSPTPHVVAFYVLCVTLSFELEHSTIFV